MEKLKGYLEGRVNDLMKKARAFEKKIETDRISLVDAQKKLVAMKSADPDGGFQNAKSELIRFQESGFFSHLLEQNMGILYSAIKEISTLDTSLDLGIKIDEDNVSMYEQIRKSPSELFTVNTNGEVELAGGEIGDNLRSDLESRGLNDDILKSIYATVPVK